ncbi:unnamed protein product [Linum tenue]|uniref:Uncharacterized protein n=1 Tax=Linum tenue TaxID=586396 RepID=A0AAV0LE83_9ROSI|nr:unnamed protein product [Linum tenue]
MGTQGGTPPTSPPSSSGHSSSANSSSTTDTDGSSSGRDSSLSPGSSGTSGTSSPFGESSSTGESSGDFGGNSGQQAATVVSGEDDLLFESRLDMLFEDGKKEVCLKSERWYQVIDDDLAKNSILLSSPPTQVFQLGFAS